MIVEDFTPGSAVQEHLYFLGRSEVMLTEALDQNKI